MLNMTAHKITARI